MTDREQRTALEQWDRLVAGGQEILARATPENPALEGATLVAIGWATIEIERAERELDAAIGEGGSWADASRDVLLGARAAVYRAVAAKRPRLVVLEADTEGRLAASLARRGEGVAAVYVTVRRGAVLAAGAFGIPAGGPLGRGRRVARGGIGEPSIIVLDVDPRTS
jgi:hypothetical protein